MAVNGDRLYRDKKYEEKMNRIFRRNVIKAKIRNFFNTVLEVMALAV